MSCICEPAVNQTKHSKMAAEGECCEEELLLELDVGFNEFDDEFLNEDEILSENSSGKKTAPKQSACVRESSESVSRGNAPAPSSKSKTESEIINLKFPKVPEEDGEVASSEEEMEISQAEPYNSREKRTTESSYPKIKTSEQLPPAVDSRRGALHTKRKAESAMEIEEEESELQQKRSRIVDEPMTVKHKRGGVKKNYNKRLSQLLELRSKQQRYIRPSTEHIFKPLGVSENNTAEEMAAEIADRLEEHKKDLIQRVVNCIGCTKTLELFRITREVQAKGGMPTADMQRRRTSGGVFLQLLKTRGFATKEQIKEIYAEENEKTKKLLKEQQAKLREKREQKMKSDFRDKLQKKSPDKEESNENTSDPLICSNGK